MKGELERGENAFSSSASAEVRAGSGNIKRLFVITGLSGAGKSFASHALEDAGFYCIDNLPPELIEQFLELTFDSGRDDVAIVCDVRGGTKFEDLFNALEQLEKRGVRHQIIFLEASDGILVRRFKETRRPHPLPEPSLEASIAKERKLLEEMRGKANVIIDTSHYTIHDLKNHMLQLADRKLVKEHLHVSLLSFGYKHGLPLDADVVFDARFLPNPHWVESLAPLTGLDEEVRAYIMKWEISRQFLSHLKEFLSFFLPNVIKEGRQQVTIAVGCTGGRHRSVCLVEETAVFLRNKRFTVETMHRDLEGKVER